MSGMGASSLRSWAAVAAVVALTNACTVMRPSPRERPPVPAPASAPRGSGGVAALLRYFDHVRNLSPAEFAAEAEKARQLYAAEKSDFRLLQYVLLLSTPRGDARRAQQLLEPLLKEGEERSLGELRTLAVLVYMDLAERRRLEMNVQAQARRADELEKKLEALKDIERSLMEREHIPGERR